MIIGPGRITSADDRCRVSWDVTLEGPDHLFPATGTRTLTAWTDWPAPYFTPEPGGLTGDSVLIAALPAALALGERLVVEDPVSARLIENVLDAMAVFHSYYGDACTPVGLEAEAVLPPPVGPARRAAFFSGGVDALFNIAETARLTRLYGTPPITDLWVVQGLDVPLDNSTLWHEVQTRLARMAAQIPGAQTVLVRTNTRDLQSGLAEWRDTGFGPLLGSLAKPFAPLVSEVLIGSAYPFAKVFPHASTPLIDPLWSCERQTVRHFTSRVSRQAKLETIVSETPELLSDLRVCYTNPGGAYNCGRCEKCLRTLLQLDLMGAQDLCQSFETPLSLESLAQLTFKPWSGRAGREFWIALQAQCRAEGRPAEAKIIARALRRGRIARGVHAVRQVPVVERVVLPVGRQVKRALRRTPPRPPAAM